VTTISRQRPICFDARQAIVQREDRCHIGMNLLRAAWLSEEWTPVCTRWSALPLAI
jgi:hypothetical protein